MLFPVAPLAALVAVVGDLALRAPAQRRTPALLLAEEAGEQVDPLDGCLFGAQLLALAEILGEGVLGGGKEVEFLRREVGKRLVMCSSITGSVSSLAGPLLLLLESICREIRRSQIRGSGLE